MTGTITSGAISGATITGGSLNSCIIGATTPSSATFTNLTVSGTLSASLSSASITSTGSTTARTLATRFADFINVKDYGAVLNGTTNDTAAFQAAKNAAPAGATIFVPPGTFYPGMSLTGSNSNLWQISGNFDNNSSVVQNIGGTNDVIQSYFGGRVYTARKVSSATDFAVANFEYNVTHDGGTTGNVTSNVIAKTYVYGGATRAPGTDTANMSGSIEVNCLGSGQYAGLSANAFRASIPANPNSLPIPEIWAFGAQCVDVTGNISSASGAMVGAEIDVYANGIDDTQSRIGINVVTGKWNSGGAAVQCGWGLLFTTGGRSGAPDGSSYGCAMAVKAPWYIAGLDFSQGSSVGSAPAIKMAAGMQISFKSDNSSFIRNTGTGLQYCNSSGGNQVFSLLDSSGLATFNYTIAVGSGGATWTSGTGAPSGTQPAGSMYSRTDGSTGTRLYVSAGGGTWNGVSGV